jgi:hypothetical protein
MGTLCKWVNEHLRIKVFHRTSEHAVKTQVWTAISVYVLVATVRKRMQIEESLSPLLSVLRLTLFGRMRSYQSFALDGRRTQTTIW